MLSGTSPSEHRITAWAYEWRNGRPTSPAGAVARHPGPWLPEEFRRRGYTTFAVSCNPWVSTWSGFDRGFDEFHDVRPWPPLPSSPLGWAARRARQMVARGDHGGREALARFARWLRRDTERPWFALVNLMELHAPYDPPFLDHPLLRRAASVGPRRARSSAGVLVRQFRQMDLRQRPDEAYVAAIGALYAGAARYADRLLERFVAEARARSGSLVVAVVSDHGENLGDHGLFAHHSSLHESLLHVPLVVWATRAELGLPPGTGVGEPVSLLGLGGWLVSVADGEPAPVTPGGMVVSEYESTERHLGVPRELRAWADRGLGALPGLARHAGVAVREGSLKFVGLANGGERLFDLDSDPAEERDVLALHADEAERFRLRFRAWLASLSEAPETSGAAVAEDEIADHLQELGYIE
jgi:arylsulfatase A-like enzyme